MKLEEMGEAIANGHAEEVATQLLGYLKRIRDIGDISTRGGLWIDPDELYRGWLVVAQVLSELEHGDGNKSL